MTCLSEVECACCIAITQIAKTPGIALLDQARAQATGPQYYSVYTATLAAYPKVSVTLVQPDNTASMLGITCLLLRLGGSHGTLVGVGLSQGVVVHPIHPAIPRPTQLPICTG